MGNMQFDSYAAAAFTDINKLFDVHELKGQTPRSYSVTLNPPANFPFLPDPEILEQKTCKTCPTAQEAKERIAKKVVKRLMEAEWIGEDSNVSAVNTKEKSPCITGFKEHNTMKESGGCHLWSKLLPSYKSRWSQNVQGYPVSLYLVTGCEDGYGLLTTAPAKHSYQLKWHDYALRLQVFTNVQCDQFQFQSILQYHRRTMESRATHLKGTRGLEQPELLLVKVKDYNIDFEAMKTQHSKKQSESTPEWLPWLCQRMERLTFWEMVRPFLPTEPPPCPLKLEKIFDCPDDIVKDEFQADLECLISNGTRSLELAAALSESIRDPQQSRESLERQVKEYLRPDRLGNLLQRSGLMYLGTRKISEDDMQDQAHKMLLALIGAHTLESDLFGAIQLWEWFIDLADEDVGENEYRSLKAANAITAACPSFLGRTSSYLEFGEEEPGEDDKDEYGRVVPGPYLRVRYEESDDALYRWKGYVVQEQRPEISSDWKPVFFDASIGTLCSPTMKYVLSSTREQKPQPLPNKCVAWLRGRPMNRLINIKHGQEETPLYEYLREEAHEEQVNGEMVYVAYLYVYYKWTKREVAYRRSLHGGLGIESFDGQKHHLKYSESYKSLVSQVITGWTLPRKVQTWILDNRRCLADIATGKKIREREQQSNGRRSNVLHDGQWNESLRAGQGADLHDRGYLCNTYRFHTPVQPRQSKLEGAVLFGGIERVEMLPLLPMRRYACPRSRD